MFIVFMILLAVGLTAATIILYNRDYDGCSTVCGLLAAALFMAVIVIGIVAIVNNSGVNGQIAKLEATRDSLVYQAENDIYENDNDLGKKQLADQIQEWNEKIVYGKEMQRNFMWGFLYPNIYDQFEPIPIDLLH